MKHYPIMKEAIQKMENYICTECLMNSSNPPPCPALKRANARNDYTDVEVPVTCKCCEKGEIVQMIV